MRILLTGATGYVGRRLLFRLMDEPGISLRLLVRDPQRLRESTRKRVEVIEGDALDIASLRQAVSGVDVAYYLIQSAWDKGDYARIDALCAENFREACIGAGVRRIVFLGHTADQQSPFLASRHKTGEILSARTDKIQTIWLRSGLIIGAGSFAFEITRSVVETLPFVFTPRWTKAPVRIMGIMDVLECLVASKDIALTGSLSLNLVGEQLSFREMIRQAAHVLQKRFIIIPLPFTLPRFSRYWLALRSPVSTHDTSLVIVSLVARMDHSSSTSDTNSLHVFPGIRPSAFQDAFRQALQESRGHVISTWTDSHEGVDPGVTSATDLSQAPYKDVRAMELGQIPAAAAFRSVKMIGGQQGWASFNILWKIRSVMSKVTGGYGTDRGRRDTADLVVGDKVDVWRVTVLEEEKRLLLEAEMRAPGEALLEYRIEDSKLIQTAYFFPRGILGIIYWYLMLPFHAYIFPDLLKSIMDRARSL